MISLGSSLTVLALAAGFISNDGQKAKLQVRHEGKPLLVEIIGVNKDGQEVQIEALPKRFRTSPNRSRKVFIEYNQQEVQYI